MVYIKVYKRYTMDNTYPSDLVLNILIDKKYLLEFSDSINSVYVCICM